VSGFAVVGRRWARALLDLAVEQKLEDTVQKGLDDVAAMLASSPALQDVFVSPNVTPAARIAVIDQLATRTGLSPLLANTLKLLAQKNRLRAVPDIARAFRELSEERGGALRAEVTTAKPLSDAYYAEIEKVLAAATGRRVKIERRTDPTLIAGVVTRVGDQVFDGSLKNRLHELASELVEP
jgi:F-type H+-transporting ATPase subunit delta